MIIESFLHQETQTYTHVLIDTYQKLCAVVDPVLDYDFKSGHATTQFIDSVIAYIKGHNLSVEYIIETHVHADHLSSAKYVKQELGGKLTIGKYITEAQETFKEVFNLDLSFKTDASQFDVLTEEGSILALGNVQITVMYVPGHTAADMAYLAKDTSDVETPLAVFVGDTLFAPDVGTARCDFPGGDAATLYTSIQKILALPINTKIYLCHDYPPQEREYSPVFTVAEQKSHNIHVHDGVSGEQFIKMRTERDATLDMPRLILPSVQVNIRAGNLPEPESNGVRYLKIPINSLS